MKFGKPWGWENQQVINTKRFPAAMLKINEKIEDDEEHSKGES